MGSHTRLRPDAYKSIRCRLVVGARYDVLAGWTRESTEQSGFLGDQAVVLGRVAESAFAFQAATRCTARYAHAVDAYGSAQCTLHRFEYERCSHLLVVLSEAGIGQWLGSLASLLMAWEYISWPFYTVFSDDLFWPHSSIQYNSKRHSPTQL